MEMKSPTLKFYLIIFSIAPSNPNLIICALQFGRSKFLCDCGFISETINFKCLSDMKHCEVKHEG